MHKVLKAEPNCVKTTLACSWCLPCTIIPEYSRNQARSRLLCPCPLNSYKGSSNYRTINLNVPFTLNFAAAEQLSAFAFHKGKRLNECVRYQHSF